ncbi:MAG: flagellar basal body P-ring formation chaperone FlgA [Hyphomonadaceae bacterium]|nr:flagellar basal body P-ring formation chaperone FlgA [Hyphomonadaceae bacterium]
MLRWYTVLACVWLFLSAAMAHADTVTLRPRIEASGQAVLLGDVFIGAGRAGARAIAPAPPPGQTSTLSVNLLAAAASAAGLSWAPPSGLSEVRVTRASGARATLPLDGGANNAGGEAVIRRGETVALIFEAPGIQLSTSARALEDGAVGDNVRLVNIASNRTVSATVTGPGAARAQ